jgi:hypothetical protein
MGGVLPGLGHSPRQAQPCALRLCYLRSRGADRSVRDACCRGSAGAGHRFLDDAFERDARRPVQVAECSVYGGPPVHHVRDADAVGLLVGKRTILDEEPIASLTIPASGTRESACHPASSDRTSSIASSRRGLT